ncbi:hypothetical protein [Pseudonocardia lacus]|uniref:hypothetical protein n=1 Tax=Pseudonocardia lacus TaxID=2835865 RepID=UPI001BDC61C8|nr:hypothetical protein [Pseudonocardia lacus]
MNTIAKLSAYGAALALIVTGAYAVGTAVGPLSTATAEASSADSGHGGMSGEAPAGAGAAGHGDSHSGTVAETAELPAGLASSRGGYTLAPPDPTLATGTTDTFSFRITGPDGAPVTAFDVAHDKRMHLIVVRRDTTGFQHVHPEMAADGTWSVPLAVPAAGSYRAFADFAPTGGEPTTLGVDLSAAGDYQPVVPVESRTAQIDGYTVELAGDLVPGQASPVALTVSRNGAPVTDLQPYLGAYGHLVALRQGDLAYLHVHPDGTPDDGVTPAGPAVEFVAEVPSAGTYRLFLDFQHDGVVRTAEFTVTTAGSAPPPAPAAPADNTADSTDAGHVDSPGAPAHGH